MALVDQIIGVESGGNPNARNPRSSAAGPAQFIDSTWLAMLAKYRPDLTGSKEELLALKSDPELSRAMAEAYAAENGGILAKAGHEVTPGSTYLAHFAGPQGAVSVLNADPSAPVGQILGDRVVKANPFLANMTAGDLRAWADKKMGGAPALTTQVRQAPTPIPAQAMTPFLPAQTASAAPIFPVQSMPQQSTPSFFEQMPAQQMQAPPPIFAPPRRPIDLSKLRAALQAPNRGLFF